MKYQQLTPEERYVISHLRKQGFTKAQIAAQTGRHRSTIGREFARNENTAGCYRPSKAQEKTNGLIRQYLPKRQSMKTLNQWDCKGIAKKLNTRPRKRLNYQTPEECYVPN